MPSDAKPNLTPKLRFPEFRDEQEWTEEELRTIADPVTERADSEDENNILTLSAEQGIVLQSEYFGKQIAGTNADRYLKIQRDDFVYNDRVTKASAYGTIKRLTKHPHGIVSPIYKCFRFKNGEQPSFWEWYFEAGAHESELRGLANEGARAGRFNVSIERFLSTSVRVPDPGEQQKIAECLSALGELIGAESQKLDALKDHKKGLMQQLFPREGETLPQLRFPEFRGTEAWARRPMGELVGFQSGFAFSSSLFGTTGRKLVTPKNFTSTGFGNFDSTLTKFTTEVVPKKYLCRPGDLLLLLTDLTPTCELLGKPLEVRESDGEVLLNQRIVRVAPTSTEVSKSFLKQFYLTEYYSRIIKKTASGSTVRHSSNKVLESLILVFPASVDEQQRIATCLSSLDDLIAAQSDKLEALTAHKKGLMQQLFPSPTEAEA